MNKCFFSGNLTRDPEIRHIPSSGNIVANFGVGSNERWLDPRSGEQRESVCFVEVECWNRQAELIGKYMRKGSKILIEGNLKFETWVGDDGINRNRIRIRMQRFEFMDSAPAEDDSVTETPQVSETIEEPETMTDSTAEVETASESPNDDVPF